jgi:hypothetical protein
MAGLDPATQGHRPRRFNRISNPRKFSVIPASVGDATLGGRVKPGHDDSLRGWERSTGGGGRHASTNPEIRANRALLPKLPQSRIQHAVCVNRAQELPPFAERR